jgi:hypothetical protein
MVPRAANQRNYFLSQLGCELVFSAAFLPSPKLWTELTIEFDTITLKLAKIQGSG